MFKKKTGKCFSFAQITNVTKFQEIIYVLIASRTPLVWQQFKHFGARAKILTRFSKLTR